MFVLTRAKANSGAKSELQIANFIPLLAVLSGSCGLAYEILYVRLFSSYFGDSFVMSGIILSAVFLGISFGAWQGHRFLHLLAWVEISIGLYAIVVSTLLAHWGFDIVQIGVSSGLNAVTLGFLIGLPAFLIGTCVPLFTAWARSRQNSEGEVFSWIYGLYNLGAFLSVILIEFVLFRSLGLQITGYVVGCLNLAIGSLLLLHKPLQQTKGHHREGTGYSKRIVGALFLASFASGVFQLFVLRFSFSVFGPLHENFAVILASAILGVAAGSWMVLQGWLKFDRALGLSALMALVFLIFVPLFVSLWTFSVGTEVGDWGELAVKVLLLGGYPLTLFVLIGSLVPLAVKALQTEHADRAILSGRLLAVSSLGNGIGTLVMFCILYQNLQLPQIGVLISGILGIAFLLVTVRLPSVPQCLVACIVILSLVFSVFQNWPKVELLLGYRALMSKESITSRVRLFEEEITYKAFDQSASLVKFSDQSSALILNGYKSLSFGPYSKSEMHEVIVGATPVLFSKNRNEALVFGLGSGITGGATARFYDRTKIVEINPAILNMPQHFTAENQNVMTRGNVEVALEDGISTLLTESKTYDAIVNTVTSPQYYSAAKLYTKDFYDIVKTRLADGGVYSSWFDVNIDQRGIAIMLNTLEESFEHCRYFLLTRAYYNVVCGQSPLIYRPSRQIQQDVNGTGVDELFARYRFDAGFLNTMDALEVDLSPRFLARETHDLNTLDHPTIEFVVARRQDAQETNAVLSQAILENIEFQRKTAFGNADWRANCKTISLMSGLEFNGC